MGQDNPFINFDAKNLKLQWTENEVPGATYGLTDSGWRDIKLFKAWILKHFFKGAVCCLHADYDLVNKSH